VTNTKHTPSAERKTINIKPGSTQNKHYTLKCDSLHDLDLTCLIPIYTHTNYMVVSSHKAASTQKILTA